MAHDKVIKLLMTPKIEAGSEDREERTPLSYAISSKHEAVVILLIARDVVSVDSKDIRGSMPFSFAAAERHERIMKLLMTRDIGVDPKDIDQRTPFSYAAKYGGERVMKLFMTRDDVGADKNTQTSLSDGTERGYTEKLKLLWARSDVDPDSRD